ncbi:E3 ubiquitin-protein ligase SIRP1 [Linum grandiflorum]
MEAFQSNAAQSPHNSHHHDLANFSAYLRVSVQINELHRQFSHTFDDGYTLRDHHLVEGLNRPAFLLRPFGMYDARPEQFNEDIDYVLTQLGVMDGDQDRMVSLSDDLTDRVAEFYGEGPPPTSDVIDFVLTVVVTYDTILEGSDEIARLMAESAEIMRRSNCGMVRTAEKAIRTMLSEVEAVNGEEICTICLDNLETPAVEMPCRHQFHEACIVNWLRKSHYCPICRFEMPTEEEMPEDEEEEYMRPDAWDVFEALEARRREEEGEIGAEGSREFAAMPMEEEMPLEEEEEDMGPDAWDVFEAIEARRREEEEIGPEDSREFTGGLHVSRF